jgi:hypothetical protein
MCCTNKSNKSQYFFSIRFFFMHEAFKHCITFEETIIWPSLQIVHGSHEFYANQDSSDKYMTKEYENRFLQASGES